MTLPIVEVKALYKSYPGVKAVNGVDLKIEPGTCFGLLGPNGAGKTTTVEMMEGITQPSSGQVLYKNQPLGKQFRNEIGIQFQHTALQEFLTVKETLTLFHSLYQNTLPMEELIEVCALKEFLRRDTNKLSGGQRQRLLLAIALVNDPELVFLDEPTTGLDPQSRHNFWELVRSIKARKKTVLLTTHYMEEAYALCDEIAIMDRGEIIAQGTPSDLLRKHFHDVILRIPIRDFKVDEASFPLPFHHDDKHIEIQTPDVNEAVNILLAHKINLQHLQIRARTLDDLFLELTGKELRT